MRSTNSHFGRNIWVAFGLTLALLVAACGDEGDELVIGQQDDAEQQDDTEQQDQAGQQEQSEQNTSPGEDGDESDDSDVSDESESALLEIVQSGGDGGVNSDITSGAPPGFPIEQCTVGENSLAVRGPDTSIRWVLGGNIHICLPLDDLWEVTVTSPDSSVRDRVWADIPTRIDFSLADQYGSYNVTATSRSGKTQSGTFEWSEPNRLLMESRAIDGGVSLLLSGYGGQREVDLAVFGDNGVLAPIYTQISFYGELPGVQLEPSGLTQLEIPADRQDICIFVDRRDGRFENPDDTCVGQARSSESLPGQRATDLALMDVLADDDAIPIGSKHIEIAAGRNVAVSTLIDRGTLDVIGAAVFEGEPHPQVTLGFSSVEEVYRVTDTSLVESFQSACDYVEQMYPRTQDPCDSGLLGEVVRLPPIELIVPKLQLLEIAEARDCRALDSDGLAIVDEGETGWLLTDGVSRLAVLDNEADAKAALVVAKFHERRCFIGRDNSRSNRRTYIAQFWLGGPKGGPTVDNQDCLSYNPAALEIVDLGEPGWRLTDGSSAMLVLDNEADAREALSLASQHSEHCFIGRNNSRSNRSSYILEYWK